MPIYEYACDRCQSQFELLVRGDDQPVCPQCGDERPAKQWSVPAAHRAENSLPVCDRPMPGPCGMGGCGLPECD